MSAPNSDISATDDPTTHSRNATIAVSTIIASIWAGLWGFNWAATHLSPDQLWWAILYGLMAGTALSALTICLAFWFLNRAIVGRTVMADILASRLVKRDPEAAREIRRRSAHSARETAGPPPSPPARDSSGPPAQS